MQKRTFGKTNLPVSMLGFGAAPVAYLDSDQDRAAMVIEKLLAAGVNLIDTAASYPGSEEFLGKRFSKRRHDFVLVSKCGQKIPESDAAEWSDELITATVDRALRQLKTDHLDVMLLHSCKLDVLEKGEALGALVKAKQAGKTRFIGYSGDNEPAAYAAGLKEVDVLETSINIADQINIDTVLPIARENNVGLLAKRPIANAAWKDISQQPGMYQNYAKTYTERLRKMAITPASVGFKPSTGHESDAWPEMALRFTLSIEGVHCAIIGTTNADNASSNVRYAKAGPLDGKVMTNLRNVFRKADPDNKWTGQT
ncbi:MAG: aldo/keto reductase [Anaerolineae bacterium]|nr:aldo/keto reductase [Phycisphaerae bacterium]